MIVKHDFGFGQLMVTKQLLLFNASAHRDTSLRQESMKRDNFTKMMQFCMM